MGYIRYHGLLITSWDLKAIERVHAVAHALFSPECISHFHNQNANLVSPIQGGITNSTYSFAVFPDGSKESWGESEKADTQRIRFTDWLRQEMYKDGSTSLSWVEVQYGDDEYDTHVVSSSDDEIQRFREQRDPDLEPEFGLPCDGDAIMP